MKKERTPQQKVKRLKIIMSAIGIMLAFILIRNCSEEHSEEVVIDSTSQMMDKVLDSLLKEVAPQGYEVFMLGTPAVIPQQMTSQSRGKLMKIEQEIATIAAMENLSDSDRSKLMQKLQEELEVYRNQIIMEESDPRLTMLVDSRRVRFTTSDGKEYACFQQHFQGIHKLKWLIEVTAEDTNINNIMED